MKKCHPLAEFSIWNIHFGIKFFKDGFFNYTWSDGYLSILWVLIATYGYFLVLLDTYCHFWVLFGTNWLDRVKMSGISSK